ncbi:PREDICTED: probable RNA-binding protein 19, partial [Wasmannia auropunctata]|uniref:probable RNA-binding protein 19 n=1 Tax=Wasmannia auropunctata TaxID=64793 RepID=UPI0005EE7740
MGYGFVRYKRKHDADRALKTLQMSVLDGKSLELKRSERTLMSDVKTARKKTKITEQTGTKILVRNIPFQATAQEMTELFKYVY